MSVTGSSSNVIFFNTEIHWQENLVLDSPVSFVHLNLYLGMWVINNVHCPGCIYMLEVWIARKYFLCSIYCFELYTQ